MKLFLLNVCLFATGFSLCASNGDRPVGARSAALGHASVTFADAWSVFNNQGSLGFIRQTQVAVAYDNHFLIKELSGKAVGLTVPFGAGAIGIGYNGLGYSLYSEHRAVLSYGIALNDKIGLGVGLDYLNTTITAPYGQSRVLTGELGFTAKALPFLSLSAHVYNPWRARLAEYHQERLPVVYRFGTVYTLSQELFLATELEKNSNSTFQLRCGMEYGPSLHLKLRAGMSSSPATLSFGFGLRYQQLSIDLSSQYQSILGVSPQIGLGYRFPASSRKTTTTSIP